MHDRDHVEVEFTPTVADFVRATWAIVRVSPGQWLAHFFPPLVGVGLLGVLAWSPLPVSPVHVLLGMVLVAMVPVMLAWNLRRALAQRASLCPMRYRFGVDGLDIANRLEYLQQQWPIIRRVRLDQGLLMLYFARNRAHCIPLRTLTADELAAVIGWAASAGVRVPR